MVVTHSLDSSADELRIGDGLYRDGRRGIAQGSGSGTKRQNQLGQIAEDSLRIGQKMSVRSCSVVLTNPVVRRLLVLSLLTLAVRELVFVAILLRAVTAVV